MNPELQGKQYPPAAPYLVGREKVREFARAVQATHPEHLDVEAARAAGHADLIAPPTFPIVVQQRTWDQLLDDPTAGVVLERIVHGDQRFTATRPIVAGDELSATLEIASVKTLGSNAMITAETAVRDAAGELVVTGGATLVVRGDAA